MVNCGIGTQCFPCMHSCLHAFGICLYSASFGWMQKHSLLWISCHRINMTQFALGCWRSFSWRVSDICKWHYNGIVLKYKNIRIRPVGCVLYWIKFLSVDKTGFSLWIFVKNNSVCRCCCSSGNGSGISPCPVGARRGLFAMGCSVARDACGKHEMFAQMSNSAGFPSNWKQARFENAE